MPMTALEKRDRRRAYAALRNARLPESLVTDGVTAPIIAAALKREREETSMAAAQWFLFSGATERAKVKRVFSKPGVKASFAARKAGR